MTDFYVRATTGLDTNDGLSWATAKATLSGVIAVPAVAGDRVFLAQGNTETGASTKNWTFPGTPAAPLRVICASDAAQPPTALAATALFTGGGSTNTTPVTQGSVHMYGAELTFGVGVALNIMTSPSLDAVQVYEKCYFNIIQTGSTTYPVIGSNSNTNTARSRMLWLDTDLRLAGSGQKVRLLQEFTWRGGALRAGGALSYLFEVGVYGKSSPIMIEGVDLSGLAVTSDLVSGPNSNGRVMFRNCALPAGWAGRLVQGTADPGLRVEMHNCDSGDTNYNLRVEAFNGTIRSDTAIVKTSGASDGTTGLSWKIETNTNPTPGTLGLETPEFMIWNTGVGSEITVSVDVLPDSGTLASNEVWLDVQYLGATGTPKGSFVSSRAILNAAPVSNSPAVWPAGGGRTPQRLSVKLTPQKAGVIHCRVVLAKPSSIVYVDPKVQVS